MRQAALARRSREALLDCPDDARRTIRHDDQWIPQPPAAHVLEEGPNRLGVLLRACHEVQEDLAALRANAPGGHHRLTRLTSSKPLGNAIDEQIDDPMLTEVARRERLVLSPQPFGNLAHRRAAQQTTACIVRERILDV